MKKRDKDDVLTKEYVKKLNFKMKFCFLLAFTMLLQLSANSVMSQKRMNFNYDNVPLKRILNEIKSQTGYRFFYNVKEIDDSQKISFRAEQETVKEVLNKLSANVNFDYKINENQIVLTQRRVTSLTSQNREIEGTVTDNSGMPLPGANIVEKGTDNGVTTDFDGKFFINVADENALLEISYIGFATKEIGVKGRSSFIIELEESTAALDEIVVVGYGKQEKAKLTTAVGILDGDDIIKTKSESIAQDIQGKIAGVQIRQQNGQPGSFSSMIQIRGLGNPIYVIDGVVRDGGDGAEEFQRLNPQDIKSISVLKDGSASIYGMNAANGAIIVTTKNGTQGKATFNYSGSTTVIRPTAIPEVFNAAQYVELQNEFSLNNGTGPTITPEELENWRRGGTGYKSTDWLGQVFKNNAFSREHTISVNGGNDEVTYYSSFGYRDDGDLTKGGDFNYEKYTFRSNVAANITKNLKAEINISGRFDKTNAPTSGIFDILFKATISRPTSSVYANDNQEYFNAAYPFIDNPVVRMNGDISGISNKRNRSFLSSAILTYTVPGLEGLKAKLLTSYDGGDSRTTDERKTYSLYNYDSGNDLYSPISPRINDPATLNLYLNNNNSYDIQAQLLYDRTIAQDHNLSTMFLYQTTKRWSDWTSAYREYAIYVKPILDQGSQDNLTNGGGYTESANVSYLGRINYDYKGKYLVEAAFRYNGSSRYAPDKRWGFFPVLSAGWNVSEESFIKDNLSFVTSLKLRGSYGKTGIDAGNPFQYIQGFTLGTGAFGYEFDDGTLTNGVLSPTLENRNLTWATSEMTDIGLDLNLWHGIVDFSFDVYQRNRSGLLGDSGAEITNTFGAALPQENINEDMTQGIEFSLGHKSGIGDFLYGIQANFNLARSKITKQVIGEFDSEAARWRNGVIDRWSGIGWGYNISGQYLDADDIYTSAVQTPQRGNTQIYPGDFSVEDVNGDGYIDGNDLTPMYYSLGIPALNYGFNIDASWKGFDFYALFQGSAKYSINIPDNIRTYMPWEGNSYSYLYDRWHRADPFDLNSEWIPGQNPTARHVNLTPPGNNGPTPRNIVDGSYLRIKSLQLGYTLPQATTEKFGVKNFRIYCNAYNVFTFYNAFLKNELKLDPEKTEGQDGRTMNYPLSSSFTLGVNLQL